MGRNKIFDQFCLAIVFGLLLFSFQNCAPALSAMESSSSNSSSSVPRPTPPPSEALYRTYAGCEAPAETFARTFYVDPVNGTDSGSGTQASPIKSFSTQLTKKLVQAGDHYILMPGDHGSINFSKYSNAALQGATSWSWIEFQDGAYLNTIAIQDMSRWLITNATVKSPTQVTLVSLNSSTNMILADSLLTTSNDSTAWGINEWVNVAPNGLQMRNTTCGSILRNRLTDIRFGMTIFSDTPNWPANSHKVLVADNVIKNFSGDGIRPTVTDILVQRNSIIDAYASSADGDANHDDGIQLFPKSLGTDANGNIIWGTLANITLDQNYILESTNPNRSWNSSMQGIGYFDGIISNLVITKNVILISGYNAVAVYGADGVTIESNTITNNTTNGRDSWILVTNSKTGVPSKSVVIRNNIASSVSLGAGITGILENNLTGKQYASYYVQWDPTIGSYDLHLKPDGPFYGKAAGAY